MKKTLILMLALIMCTAVMAQRGPRGSRQRLGGNPERTMEQIDSTKLAPFKAMQMDGPDGMLKYREARIDVQTADKPALVIYMHGASGRGQDNTREMRQLGIYSIYDYMAKAGIKGYLVVPQCPEDYYWAGNRECKPYTDNVKHLIKQYIERGNADPSRVYNFGVSMGGGGTWKLLGEMPDTFAAALIASGQYRDMNLKKAAKTPVCLTIGGAEGSRCKDFQNMAEELKDKGGDVMFDILPGLDHPETCVQSFTDERMAWVFSHKRE